MCIDIDIDVDISHGYLHIYIHCCSIHKKSENGVINLYAN